MTIRPTSGAVRFGALPSEEGAVLARTESICPRCRGVLDAELIVQDGRVILSRTCPDHGEFAAVVYGDARRYVEIQRFNKPGESRWSARPR